MSKPSGKGWYLAAGGVALGGIGAAILLAFLLFPSLEPLARFVAPGGATVEVASAGTYALWHEHSTVFEGRTFKSEPELPAGARFEVRAPDGTAVRVGSAGNQTMSDGRGQRRAAGRFEAAAPGPYRVSVEGLSEPRVISVSGEFFLRMFAAIGGAILLGLLSLGAGIGIAAYAAGRQPARSVAPRAAAAPAAAAVEPSPGLRERRLKDLAMVVYVLQAASFLTLFTLVGGAVVNYLKRREVEGTWLESHFRWQLRTFWWTVAWSFTGLVTAAFLVGFLIWIAGAVWLIYRIAVGWIDLNAGEPMD